MDLMEQKPSKLNNAFQSAFQSTSPHSLRETHWTTTNSKALFAEILEELKPRLPIQNPMPFYVHNNPLQHWESFSFYEGLVDAAITYETGLDDASRGYWRELEDFVLPIVISYFDQGLSRWRPEHHSISLWDWYCEYISSSLSLKSPILNPLKSTVQDFRRRSPEDNTIDILEHRFSDKNDWAHHLEALIFHFKGWSGMIHNLENNPQLFPLIKYPCHVLDWIALLVTSEFALHSLIHTPPHSLWSLKRREQRAHDLFRKLENLRFTEFNHYNEVIKGLKQHIRQIHKKEEKSHREKAPSVPTKDTTPPIQALFCIDDREESLRRSLEGVSAKVATHGTVGFFGIDFQLKPYGQVIEQPQCPPVITPTKRAIEVNPTESKSFFQILRERIPLMNESRFTLLEPLMTLLFWPAYASILIFRSFAPRWYRSLTRGFKSEGHSRTQTEIQFIDGYSLDEKAKIVARILKGAGLHSISSPLFFVIGHSASMSNNPFKKSYGCGACSGQSGFPNAKVFSMFANNPLVRENLQQTHQVSINNSTVFIASCHDTASDEIEFAPRPTSIQNLWSDEHEVLFQNFKVDINRALKLNKKERWKQFHLPIHQGPRQRASDWSQPRPEFGHTGASIAIFGPRWLTKGYNLKRQSFLISYDPQTDTDGESLAFNILSALPVCANINLDYFTSALFPQVFGSGSKLPLNVASGIGLMQGSKGDLKIGLATQMTDQHKPIRLLAFIYADEAELDRVMTQSPRLTRLIENHWIHIVRIDPQSLKFSAYSKELRDELTLFS